MGKKLAMGLLLLAVVIGLVSCGGSSGKKSPQTGSSATGTVVIVGEKS